MKKNIRIIAIGVCLTVFIASCARSITPYQAAHGKAKCGRSLR
ncbi:MAG TPA: hypothetical protein PKY29_00090 [Ferruginibacter sp.]|nr:hypothetical protein [Ferruginibacter sp.]HRO16703.1 hypothetical protein [Ferruginibacter sp.]HRQ19675.1 hypothetical protein [Ferruginibacter sp.]